jgi:hypothetical protein
LTTSPKECDEIDEENGSRPPRKWVPDHAGRAIIACLRDAALRQLLRQADLTIGDPDLGTPVDQLGRQRSADAGRAVTNAIFPDTLDAIAEG